MAIKIVGAILRTKEQTKHCSLKALSLGSSLLVNCGFQRDSLRNKIAAMLKRLQMSITGSWYQENLCNLKLETMT
jgi:hypothetical protein